MIKIFVTGDNHIGIKYDKYPEVKKELGKSRIDCFEKMVRDAEIEQCDLFVVTGDLFDNTEKINKSDIKEIVKTLSRFNGNVLILPGNHDYYTGKENTWIEFEKQLDSCKHNITLLKEFKPYSFEVGDERVKVYPALCRSKHSAKNNLKWIKDEDLSVDDSYKIGIAHGAIAGLTPDMESEYFLMTESELMSIPIDIWLIGHTHIQYPKLNEKDTETDYRIFNAGTHEQTDLSNNTEGCCFVITIDKSEGKTSVFAHKYLSGKIRYKELRITVIPDSDSSLADAIRREVSNIEDNYIVRVRIIGTIKAAEYGNKEIIYDDILNKFIAHRVVDDELREEIDIDRIHSEFSELSFASKLMESLIDDPFEMQLAYELVNECKE